MIPAFWFSALFELDPSDTHTSPLDSALGGLEGDLNFQGSALVVEDNEAEQQGTRMYEGDHSGRPR